MIVPIDPTRSKSNFVFQTSLDRKFDFFFPFSGWLKKISFSGLSSVEVDSVTLQEMARLMARIEKRRFNQRS